LNRLDKNKIKDVLHKDISSTKINSRILSLFLKQLSLLLSSGIGLDKSLYIIEKQNLDNKLTKALASINKDLDSGYSIYEAFYNNKKSFDPLIIAFIKSGDESGKMAEILDELSFYIEEDSKNKTAFKQALIYPIILLLVCIAIVGLLVNFVLPTFQEVFDSSGQSLPKATIILINIANFFKDYGLVFMIFIVVIVISIFILRKDEVIRFKLDKFNFLKLPFSSFRRLKLEYQFTSLLYILRRGDINIVSSLYIIKDSFTNTYIKMIIDELIIDLKNGYNLSSSLANKNIFFPLFLSMIKIGEDSGNLIESLKKSSEYYANDYIYKLRRMSQVAEPAIIIFMSLIVAFVVFSVAIPIFDSVNNIAY
jgi:hypothetical protein